MPYQYIENGKTVHDNGKIQHNYKHTEQSVYISEHKTAPFVFYLIVETTSIAFTS